VRLSVRVPATVANVGPGFDSFALAVSLSNEVTLDTEGEPGIHVEGEGAGELPEDDSNLVLRSIAYLFSKGPDSPPRVAVRCVNNIPLERGLGSSASAVVAGLVLGDRLMGQNLARTHPDWLLKWAVDLEGHADNAAAALRGGIVLAYRATESWKIESLAPHESLRPVLLVPENERVSTAQARASLPAEVPLDSFVFNTSRAALLVLALTSRPDLLGEALRDNVHQEHRLALAPRSDELFWRLVEMEIPVCVAGSGPSLLAFETEGARIPDPGPGWRVIRAEFAGGAEIVEE
jgi:homoserine kinase